MTISMLNFMAIWYILWPFLYILFPFWYFASRKIWQPCLGI
jgi:hypothetical protein